MTQQAESGDPPTALLDLIVPYITASGRGRLRADADLMKLGLDSAGVISVLADVEDAFGVEFPGEALNRSTFETPQALWSVVLGLLECTNRNSGTVSGNETPV